MVMSSQQIAGMIAGQQSMFGNFASYAQQITPTYGVGPGMGYGAPPPTYQPFTGAMMGPPPPMPPMPVQQAWGPQMMHPMMAMAMAPPGTYGQQALAERMLGTGFAGLTTLGNAAGTINAGAGMAAMFGVGGAGMAMAGGLPMAGAVMAGQYGVEQGYQGFLQRQQVNRVLRNRFGGMMGVGQGRGGVGFSTDEMGQISQMVREMGTEDLYTNMEELTRVMDRTAQMGLYRGVRSARQFRERFQQTVDSLREIAETMHTTLEGATEFMEGSRRMGFFTGQDISRQLQQTRVVAGATGMSVGQVQAGMAQGAQMARMWGGRGRAGAMAMQQQMGAIGVAQQMGILSDEEMAFATGGLTGAEGAQSLAGTMMQANQRWLRSGAGRVSLAALWDPETGGINQGLLRRVQSGAISLGELRGMGRRNIAQTGGRQSDFFRREAELRGQLQEAGGMETLWMAQIEQHLGERGIDLESPAAQRFVMRRFGVNQGQAEALLEMHQQMPRIRAEMMVRTRQQTEAEALGRSREGSGIRGMGRRLGRWWEEHFQNPFREAGDRLVTDVTRGVEDAVSRLEGRVKMRISQEAEVAMMELAETGNITGGGGSILGLGGAETAEELMAWHRGAERRGITAGPFALEGRTWRSKGQLLGLQGIDLATRAKMMRAWDTRVHGEGALGGGVGLHDTERIQNWVNEHTRMMGRRSEEFGFDATAMRELGQETRRLAMKQLNTESRRAAWQKRARGAGALASVEERWAYMERHGSDALRSAMAKARTMEDRVALLAEFERSGELAKGFRSGAGGMGAGVFGEYDVDFMQAVGDKRSILYEQLMGITSQPTSGWDWTNRGTFGVARRKEGAAGGAQELLGLTMGGVGGLTDLVTGYGGAIEKRGRLIAKAPGGQVFGGMMEAGGGILRTGGKGITRFATKAGLLEEGIRIAGGIFGQTTFTGQDIKGLLEDKEIRGLISEWKQGEKDVSGEAYRRLQELAAGEGGQLSESRRAALGRLIDASSDSDAAAAILHDISIYDSLESNRAVLSKVGGWGRALSGRLDDMMMWAKSGGEGRERAVGQLREIARLREAAERVGSDPKRAGEADEMIQRAQRLENQFYAKYGGTEMGAELIQALSEGSGGEYIAMGLAEAEQATRRYRGIGERYGKKKVTQTIISDIMRGFGIEGMESLEGVGKGRKGQRQIATMVQQLQAGGETAALARKKLLAAAGDIEDPVMSTRYRERIEKAIQMAAGGFSEEEIGQLVSGGAAGKAQEARLRGDAEEKRSEAKVQEAQLNQLKAIATFTGIIAERKEIKPDQIAAAIKAAGLGGPPTADRE